MAQRLGRRPARRPALDPEQRRRPVPGSCASQRVAEPADRRVILEHEDAARAPRTACSSQSASTRLSHGMHEPRARAPLLRAAPAAVSASLSMTGPYATSTASPPSRSDAPAARLERPVAARSGAATARSRAGSRRSLRPRSTAQRRTRASPPRSPAERSSCPGSAPSSEMSRTLLMRLARPGRDETRVVERVDHLRALARLVVDLLVRAGREETTRTS